MRVFALACASLFFVAPVLAQSFVGYIPLRSINGHPVGLGHDGSGKLLFTDFMWPSEIGLADTSGSILRRADVRTSTNTAAGITTDGTSSIWVTDTMNRRVRRFTMSFGYLESFSVANETSFPKGITYRGASRTLYVVAGELNGTSVFEYDVQGNLLSTSVPLNGLARNGIAWDPSDDTFWVYDQATDSLRHCSNSFVELSSVPGTAANGLGPGEGVAVIGDRIYVCATTYQLVAIFDKAAGIRGEATRYGRGCPAPADFYELFADGAKDLDGLSITLTPNRSAYVVTAGGAFDQRFSNDLSAGDDDLFPNNSLGFAINVPGYGSVNSVDIDSNGRCGFGIPRSDYTETVGEFLGGNGAILAANWDDLAPDNGGGVYFDTFSDRALITWSQVPQFSAVGSNTFQVQIFRSGQIVMAWQQIEGDGLVGFSSGAGIADPGQIDLSAALPFAGTGGVPLTLDATSRPVIGRPLITVTTNVPSGAILASLLVFFARAEITAPIFPPSCTIYATGNLDAFPIDPRTRQAGFPMPNDPWLVGQSIYAQSVIADPSIPSLAPVYLSNGLELRIGDY